MTRSVPTPRLGVCYYPEHWPREWWRNDAQRMREMGLSQVRIGEFAWSRIEPAPGQFDWSWLDEAIEILQDAGLSIVLCTPTATPPKWLVDAMPEMPVSWDPGTTGLGVPLARDAPAPTRAPVPSRMGRPRFSPPPRLEATGAGLQKEGARAPLASLTTVLETAAGLLGLAPASARYSAGPLPPACGDSQAEPGAGSSIARSAHAACGSARSVSARSRRALLRVCAGSAAASALRSPPASALSSVA